MQIKPAGIDDLAALVHVVNALLEHAPPVTRNIFEGLAGQHIKAIEAVLNPLADKNQDHG